MDIGAYEAIQSDPNYQELVRRRSLLGWFLSAIMLAIYLGFVLLVAYAPETLALPLGAGITTIGIPLGLFVIASAVVLTGIYASRANAEYDALIHKIIGKSRP